MRGLPARYRSLLWYREGSASVSVQRSLSGSHDKMFRTLAGRISGGTVRIAIALLLMGKDRDK